MLFSSAAAYFGNIGQSDYALANEILNKTAYRLQHDHPNSHIQVLDWGPWDGGMVTPALKKMFTANNIDLIPLEDGAKTLVQEMQTSNPHTQVVVGSGFAQPPRPLTQTLHTHQIERVINPAANPFLDHHRINKKRVLPLVHALHWMIQSAEGLYAGYQFVECTDFSVLKGVITEEPTTYRLTLTETQKTSGNPQFLMQVSPPRVHQPALLPCQTHIGHQQ